MCGRFTMTKKQQSVVEQYNAEVEGTINEIFNAAPTHKLPVIPDNDPGKIKFFRWGFEQQQHKNTIINAKSETLKEKRTFENLVQTQRCLILADGFYEWKTSGKQKTPYHIGLQNNELFAFAGIWNKTETSLIITYSFVIITTTANSDMQSIHNRMPVILTRENEKLWLDQSLPEHEVLNMLKPLPDGQLKIYPVSNAINSVYANGSNLIAPYHIDANQQLLF
jgi:putative SOS response-associated peptidase YedK